MPMSSDIAFPGTLKRFRLPELLDRHPVLRDAVERPAAVCRRRVHREDEARQMTTTKKLRRSRPNELVQRPDVVEGLDGLGTDSACESDRHERVDHEDEDRRRQQGLSRVVDGVLVLGREGRGRFGRGRPDHDPDPDQRELQAPPGETGVAELEGEVGGVEVAVEERQEREAEERDHQQGAGQIVERNGDPRAEDVEGPDAEDQPDGDQVLEPDVHAAGREVAVVDLRAAEGVRAVRLVWEPRGLGDVAGEQAEERQHDRPADPVAECRHGPDERRVLPPALVRVDRDAARLLREHRGELRVEDDDRDDDDRRDSPDQRRAPATEVEHRPAERAEQEARIREANHEAVVPAQSLEEVSLLDCRNCHSTPPCSLCESPTRTRANPRSRRP